MGIILSTLGAIIISVSSIYENIYLLNNKIKIIKKRQLKPYLLNNLEEINSENEDKEKGINNYNTYKIKVPKLNYDTNDSSSSNFISAKSTENGSISNDNFLKRIYMPNDISEINSSFSKSNDDIIFVK